MPQFDFGVGDILRRRTKSPPKGAPSSTDLVGNKTAKPNFNNTATSAQTRRNAANQKPAKANNVKPARQTTSDEIAKPASQAQRKAQDPTNIEWAGQEIDRRFPGLSPERRQQMISYLWHRAGGKYSDVRKSRQVGTDKQGRPLSVGRQGFEVHLDSMMDVLKQSGFNGLVAAADETREMRDGTKAKQPFTYADTEEEKHAAFSQRLNQLNESRSDYANQNPNDPNGFYEPDDVDSAYVGMGAPIGIGNWYIEVGGSDNNVGNPIGRAHLRGKAIRKESAASDSDLNLAIDSAFYVTSPFTALNTIRTGKAQEEWTAGERAVTQVGDFAFQLVASMGLSAATTPARAASIANSLGRIGFSAERFTPMVERASALLARMGTLRPSLSRSTFPASPI